MLLSSIYWKNTWGFLAAGARIPLGGTQPFTYPMETTETWIYWGTLPKVSTAALYIMTEPGSRLRSWATDHMCKWVQPHCKVRRQREKEYMSTGGKAALSAGQAQRPPAAHPVLEVPSFG